MPNLVTIPWANGGPPLCPFCGQWPDEVRSSIVCETCGIILLEEHWCKRPSPWKPIATAPKEGYVFLLDPLETPEAIVGEWDARKQRWESRWMDGEGNCVVLDPTHWMPIPDSPEATR